MVRVIFFSMAIAALSFVIIPVFNGVSEERDALTQTALAPIPSDDGLSFEEIYEIADQNATIDPAMLNAIEPAAGDTAQQDVFSNGFSGREDSALADTAPIIEAETETQSNL